MRSILISSLMPLLLLLPGCAMSDRARVASLEARLSTVSGPPYVVGSSVGDWVEYRYGGTLRSAPLVVRKQVMSVAPDRLVVEITLIREGRRRTWRELVEVIRAPSRDEREKAGASMGVPANMPFHAWVLSGATVEKVTGVRPCELEVDGTSYSCECRGGLVSWRGRELSFMDPVCPGFSWAHGPARYRDVDTGEIVLDVEVVRAGRMFFRASDLPDVD